MEISAAKRERDFYLSRVDRSKGIAAMQQRKEQKAAEAQPSGAAAAAERAGTAAGGEPAAGRRRHAAAAEAKQRVRGYGQRKPKADSVGAAAATLPPSLLSLIAGKPQT